MKYLKNVLYKNSDFVNEHFIYLFSILSKVRYTFTLLISFFFLLSFSSEAQQLSLSEDAEISILTIGPGPNLYDKFGHSAFRIKDDNRQWDSIFNYGTFDFNTPNFYTKFAQGKLLYSLSTGAYNSFYQTYVSQDRWVKEQVLNLTYAEKQALFEYLINNAQPENKDYLYDFCFDNCATRIRDVLTEALNENVNHDDSYLAETKTFRELIQQNVYANSWGSLGMDAAIGSVTDIEATPWQHQFLPQYVFEAAENATLTRNGERVPLVKKTQVLYQNSGEQPRPSFIMSPLFVFGLLALLIIWITYKDKRAGVRSRYLDSVLFLVTGLVGVVLLLLWFATDHSATQNNYNVLWAFPFSLLFFVAIGRKKPRKWLQRYVIFLILLLLLLVLHTITGVQKFAIGFIPLFIALGIRYVYLVSFLKKNKREPMVKMQE
ncbi:MAG: DUF4105 domain-containing protein [Bacteroidota bacterium]